MSDSPNPTPGLAQRIAEVIYPHTIASQLMRPPYSAQVKQEALLAGVIQEVLAQDPVLREVSEALERAMIVHDFHGHVVVADDLRAALTNLNALRKGKQ